MNFHPASCLTIFDESDGFVAGTAVAADVVDFEAAAAAAEGAGVTGFTAAAGTAGLLATGGGEGVGFTTGGAGTGAKVGATTAAVIAGAGPTDGVIPFLASSVAKSSSSSDDDIFCGT